MPATDIVGAAGAYASYRNEPSSGRLVVLQLAAYRRTLATLTTACPRQPTCPNTDIRGTCLL